MTFDRLVPAVLFRAPAADAPADPAPETWRRTGETALDPFAVPRSEAAGAAGPLSRP